MAASLQQTSEQHLMYLVEMFPAVDVDSIIAIIANRPHSSIESLVEDCLALDTDVFMLPSAPPLPASSHSALSDPGESAAQEAVSLVPVSWAPQSAAATFSRASTSSSHSSCANHVSEIDAEPGAKSPRSVALPANDDSVSKAAAAIIQNTNAGGAKATIETVIRMLKLVQENPSVEKYRVIQLGNSAFQSRVGRVRGGIELLVALGFEASDGLLILPSRGADELAVLGAHHRTLEACLADFLPHVAPSPRKQFESATGSAAPALLVSSKHFERERIAEIHEKRIKAGSLAAPLLPQASTSSAASATSPASAAAAPRTQPTSGNGIDAWLHNSNARRQIEQMRASQHSKWRNSQLERRRAWTLADLDAKRASDQEAAAAFGGGGSGAAAASRFRTLSDFNITNPNDIGEESLRLTNEFRKAQKLPALEWSQELANIGLVHSRDMGEGRVPFSHQGFEKRVRDYPFHSRSAAENVAWSHNLPPASAAVDGWIDSPGHRKNLLSAHNCCGIGVFRTADGRYFLTQLFGLR